MDFEQALAYTHSLEKFGIRLGLGRMLCVLELLGDPQEKIPVIHVAGTNGKGSSCAFIESALRAEGYLTGLYTSPFVTEFTERIRIAGQNVSRDEYAAAATRVRSVAESGGVPLTEFEFITACAFVIFADRGVERLVLETGLGGRLDATNAVKKPLACLITSISLDHTAVLGSTVTAIAGEKAGIIKPGCPVFMAADNPAQAVDTVAARARELGSPFTLCERPQNVAVTLDGTSFCMADGSRFVTSLAGGHQAANAAAAVTLLRSLGTSAGAIVRGLESARNPARFEVLRRDPLLVLDGGHNPGCAEALRAALEQTAPGEKPDFVIGMMADKDVEQYLRILSPLFASVTAVAPAVPRAMPARELERIAKKYCERTSSAVIGPAFAKRICSLDRSAVVCGSLYLAGEIRPLLLAALDSQSD